MAALADSLPEGRTGTFLIRSATEIAAALESMRADRTILTAGVQHGELLFLSRVLQVTPSRDAIVIACSEWRAANHALLASASAAFSCNHDGHNFEFIASHPREGEFSRELAILLDFPDALLVRQRRVHARVVVPDSAPLKCVVELGALRFDARIVDISRHGVGTLIYEPGVRLEPGTLLPRVRIEHPQRAVLVALEVRHARRITLPDGRPAMRAGCRIVGAHHDIDELIRLFITELPG